MSEGEAKPIWPQLSEQPTAIIPPGEAWLPDSEDFDAQAEEFVTTFRTYEEHSQDTIIESLLEETIFNETFIHQNPVLSLKIFDKLSTDSHVELRLSAASGIAPIIKIDKAEGLRIFEKLAVDEDQEVVEEVGRALDDIMGQLGVLELDVNEMMPILNHYAKSLNENKDKA